MRVCPRCGKEYGDTVAFCFADGMPTNVVAEQAPAVLDEPTPEALPEVVSEHEPVEEAFEVTSPEDATDAPSLSEVSVDLAAERVADEPVETAPVEPALDEGPERIDAPLAQKDDEPAAEEAFFDAPVADDLDDEPLEPAGRSNGLLIGMALAALAMLGVGGWLLWQSIGPNGAVAEVPDPIVEPMVEEPVVEAEEPIEEPVVELVEEPVVEEEPVIEEEPVVEEPVVEAKEPAKQPAKVTKSSGGSKSSTTGVSGLGASKNSKVGRAKKKGEAAPPPPEEDPWGDPAKEAPVEETPAEETPAEETPAEEAPADDALKGGKAKKKGTPAEDESPWGEVE